MFPFERLRRRPSKLPVVRSGLRVAFSLNDGLVKADALRRPLLAARLKTNALAAQIGFADPFVGHQIIGRAA